jgi:hypothetical protein
VAEDDWALDPKPGAPRYIVGVDFGTASSTTVMEFVATGTPPSYTIHVDNEYMDPDRFRRAIEQAIRAARPRWRGPMAWQNREACHREARRRSYRRAAMDAARLHHDSCLCPYCTWEERGQG